MTHTENKKPGKDGRITLIWKFRKCGVGAWNDTHTHTHTHRK